MRCHRASGVVHHAPSRRASPAAVPRRSARSRPLSDPPLRNHILIFTWQTHAVNWTPDRDALRGRVAVVAGATRGAGRGIAAALGEAGATVICTGRSSRTRAILSDYNRDETIEDTAELVTHLGGTGIAIAVDHLRSEERRV